MEIKKIDVRRKHRYGVDVKFWNEKFRSVGTGVDANAIKDAVRGVFAAQVPATVAFDYGTVYVFCSVAKPSLLTDAFLGKVRKVAEEAKSKAEELANSLLAAHRTRREDTEKAEKLARSAEHVARFIQKAAQTTSKDVCRYDQRLAALKAEVKEEMKKQVEKTFNHVPQEILFL